MTAFAGKTTTSWDHAGAAKPTITITIIDILNHVFIVFLLNADECSVSIIFIGYPCIYWLALLHFSVVRSTPVHSQKMAANLFVEYSVDKSGGP